MSAIKDLKKYQTSSKLTCFKECLKLNPLNYHYEILSYHSTRDKATIEEARLHELYNIGLNPLYFNIVKQTITGFSTTGMVTTSDSDGNIFFIHVNDERYKSGELIALSKNRVTVNNGEGPSSFITVIMGLPSLSRVHRTSPSVSTKRNPLELLVSGLSSLDIILITIDFIVVPNSN